MTDNITLPREVVEEALEALEYENSWHEPRNEKPYASTLDAITALRTHLAAETPKRSKDIVAGGEAGSGDIVFKGFIDSQSADSLGRIANAIERLAAEQQKIRDEVRNMK